MRTARHPRFVSLEARNAPTPLRWPIPAKALAGLAALALLASACSETDTAAPSPESDPATSAAPEPEPAPESVPEETADPAPELEQTSEAAADPAPELEQTSEAAADPAPEPAPPEESEPASTADPADDTQPAGAPSDIPEGAFLDISAGVDHACGLRIDRSIVCWGGGTGAIGVPEGPFSAVSSGWGYTCGLRVDSTAVCWSGSSDGGPGETIAPIGQFIAVAAGWGLVCGLRTDSDLSCWGSNRSSEAPPAGAMFSAVDIGLSHSCGLLVDSSVVCWGSNRSGESDAPEGRFASVSVGWSHSCGLLVDSSVVCWGSNRSGESDAPGARYISISAGGAQTCGLRPDNTLACWGSALPRVPAGLELPELEPVAEPEQTQPEPEPEQPAEPVRVVAGRANWSSGYFQASLFKQLLEELGYEVTDPADFEVGPNNGYLAIAQGDMDYWPNSWYPNHYAWHLSVLPDGTRVGDHVTVVGEQLIEGGLQGFLVTKSFADTYGVYTLDDLNRDSRALAAFDTADPVPGNGKADVFGCPEAWTCDNIIENMIAFSGWENIEQVQLDYEVMFDQALTRADRGDPMVFYTWTPTSYITQLRPGDNVYWMGMERILDDSNPADQVNGEQHTQRTADGTGGYASIGPEECPSAADQPNGKCPLGWIAADILVTANNEFLEANPTARALFEAVRLSHLDTSRAWVDQSLGLPPDSVAALWIRDNRGVVDQWLAVARAAG